MVYFNPEISLDRTFGALADPTRRAMLAQLSERGTLSAGELGKPFAVSLPAVLKHIGVLAAAGLVKREKIGRTVLLSLDASPMREARSWLEHYERFWSQRLDALAALVEEDETCRSKPSPGSKQPSKPDRASPSSATSRRRSRRSTGPGPKARR
jgi:DNA-binding transcriptional ArsR family regulator